MKRYKPTVRYFTTAKYKVVEIIDAISIRVTPQWSYTFPGTSQPITHDIVKMAGFDVDPGHKFIKRGLTDFLLGRFVKLYNPILLDNPTGQAIMECIVDVDGTDLAYLFPELRIKEIAEKTYTD